MMSLPQPKDLPNFIFQLWRHDARIALVLGIDPGCCIDGHSRLSPVLCEDVREIHAKG